MSTLPAAPVPGLVRRTYMTEPGEGLELAVSTLRSAARYRTWLVDTGIGPQWTAPNPLCCVPLPTYPAAWPAGHRRWPGLRAGMLWHPLLWLPERLATRYTLIDDTGRRSTEPDEVWALRVCLELTASGLYDPETGSWLDVLSLAGLDTDEKDTQTRVDAWLTGRDDPILDGLDLAEHVDRPADPDWAVHAAIDELPALQVISWAVTAADLLDACDQLTDLGAARGLVWVRRSAAAVAGLAAANLKGLPDDGDQSGPATGATQGPTPVTGHALELAASGEAAWWDGMSRRIGGFTGDPLELLDTLVRDMADRLGTVLDRYASDAAALHAADPPR